MPYRQLDGVAEEFYRIITEQEQHLTKQASVNKIVYSENKDLFTKVGFDLFRENDSEMIWKLEADEDGNEFLIKTDIKDEGSEKLMTESNWRVVHDSKKENVTLAYKSSAIYRFSSKEHGFTPSTINDFKRKILAKVEDKEFVETILVDQTSEMREGILSKFPELL